MPKVKVRLPVRRTILRVSLKNYRSIAACSVELGPLTFLVGPNGSGKSNFLDALRLVSDSLRTSLEHALRERGGIKEVRRRSSGHPTHFGVRLDFRLPNGQSGHYAFEVGARRGAFAVNREECVAGEAFYDIRSGELRQASVQVMPPPSPDRLHLVAASGLPEFRPVFDALSRMGFYNIQPERIRALQTPDQGDLLTRDGSNLASVVEHIASSHPEVMKRIEDFLGRVVPGIEGVRAKPVGHMVSLEFRQRVEGVEDPWRFPAINMSDGTLRALSILVALFQPGIRDGVPLVGVEEPEVALHPAAAGVLLDAFRAATRQTQVVLTSHSPDLLEDSRLQAEEIIAVDSQAGTTRMGRVDEASRNAIAEQLYTPGELLRANQLQPDEASLATPSTLELFPDRS